MNTYRPDSWVIVELDSVKHGKVYKVLASWYGGFTTGDSWKLSSGIEDIFNFSEGVYTMPQSSGSVYEVVSGNEHMSKIMHSVFSSFVEDAEAPDSGFTIRILEMSEFLELLKADSKLLEH